MGKFQVINKSLVPGCKKEYSANIVKQASMKIDAEKCADIKYLQSGDRSLEAIIQISFHPLVVTGSDRIYKLQCVDHQPQDGRNFFQESDCKHIVRAASTFLNETEYSIGDSVVHEWSCNKTIIEGMGPTNAFLTNCLAVSQDGKIIRIIDDNGCIIDSELMGELSYSNYYPKIYARSRMFQLISSLRYRFECFVDVCMKKNGTCTDRVFPPRCSFTREEIIKREEQKAKKLPIVSTDRLLTGAAISGFDKRFKVISPWITVTANQYMNIGNIHERYFIRGVVNRTLNEDDLEEDQPDHFLMGISYRGSKLAHPFGPNKPLKFWQLPNRIGLKKTIEKLALEKKIKKPAKLKLYKNLGPNNSTILPTLVHASNENNMNSTSLISTTSEISTITSSTTISTEKSERDREHRADSESSLENLNGKAPNHAYHEDSPSTLPFLATDRTFEPEEEEETKTTSVGPESKLLHDWRLDDSVINDTDILLPSGRQMIYCGNSTEEIMARMKLTGVEYLLIVWSFGSVLVWICILATCLYQRSRKKNWLQIRDSNAPSTNMQPCSIHSPEQSWVQQYRNYENNRGASEDLTVSNRSF
ncbi:hypothetical protein WR25_13781 [Diploscapter pachys]|uniref:ZP domain-containing protein n=1 Tax=Diploscapter pachys TaxID=2018661 RepID=A0A2A2JHU0_9BILA|nr:hypothetical protein WR25_13781 [Diploscapter pachys]